MKATEIYQMANDIAEDTIPETLFLQMLNVARNKREDSRPWQMLKKTDSSQYANPGDSWQTAKTLPADFRRDYRMFVGEDYEYTPLPIEELVPYRNAARRYAVDLAGNAFYLTGSVGTASKIYLIYIKTTTDWTQGNKDTDGICVWPDRFQPLLAFDVAAMYQGGVDYDEPAAKMSLFNRAMAKELEDAMVAWDTELALRSMNNSFAGNGEAMVDLGRM